MTAWQVYFDWAVVVVMLSQLWQLVGLRARVKALEKDDARE